MKFYIRTSDNAAVSFGWVGALIYAMVMVACALLLWAVRLVMAVCLTVGLITAWCWRRVHNDEDPQPERGLGV